MRRIKMILASVAIVPSLGFFFWKSQSEKTDPLRDMLEMSPSPAEIRASLNEPLTKQGKETPLEAKKRTFREMFKARFRLNEPRLAIGLQFWKNGDVKLMFPARLEPWAMDRIAVAAWNEVRANFGYAPNINLYETYIGMAPVSVGTLRLVPGTKDQIRIVYKYSPAKYGPQHM